MRWSSIVLPILVMTAFLMFAAQLVAIVWIGKIAPWSLEVGALAKGFALLLRSLQLSFSVEILAGFLRVLAAFDDANLLVVGFLSRHWSCLRSGAAHLRYSFVRTNLLTRIDAAASPRIVLNIALDSILTLEELVTFFDRALRGADAGIVGNVHVARLLAFEMLGAAHDGLLLKLQL
jgi:hypothetical protein